MTTPTDREQFEAWATPLFNVAHGKHDYLHEDTRVAWFAWQAARASQVAAPPAQKIECSVCDGKGWFPNKKWIAGNGAPATLPCWHDTAPPALPAEQIAITCQIYGHVVGHCADCNVGAEQTELSDAAESLIHYLESLGIENKAMDVLRNALTAKGKQS